MRYNAHVIDRFVAINDTVISYVAELRASRNTAIDTDWKSLADGLESASAHFLMPLIASEMGLWEPELAVFTG
jgi:hypothetical protein